MVAYEPIWAIGTGRNATPDDANATIGVIRATLRDLVGDDRPTSMRILYGGSVKPGNVAELMAMPEIDGGLVGGASLDPDDFARIIRYAQISCLPARSVALPGSVRNRLPTRRPSQCSSNATLIAIHVIVSLILIVFILLHSGRGGGLSDMFGGAGRRLDRPDPRWSRGTSTG